LLAGYRILQIAGYPAEYPATVAITFYYISIRTLQLGFRDFEIAKIASMLYTTGNFYVEPDIWLDIRYPALPDIRYLAFRFLAGYPMQPYTATG
jgi:hypothetical protein